jgi:NAD(P)H-quinone oxidoreductase subunit 6
MGDALQNLAGTFTVETLVFYIVAFVVVGGGVVVTFSRNIVHSAFALLIALAGVSAAFAMLGADFVAACQMIVYIGGVVVLILFAVLLTNRVYDVQVTNRSVGTIPGIAMGAGLAAVIGFVAVETPFGAGHGRLPTPTTVEIGDALLGPYLLPFEVISILLLVAAIGAIVVARKELKEKE